MVEPCPVCELLGRADHGGANVPLAIDGWPEFECDHGPMVMRLAERFSTVPFVTVVDAVRRSAAALRMRGLTPSDGDVERESMVRLLRDVPSGIVSPGPSL